MIVVKIGGGEGINYDAILSDVAALDEETVITGSLNFSANADESNDENTLIITSQQIAGLYYEEFQRRWQEAASLDVNQFQCE